MVEDVKDLLEEENENMPDDLQEIDFDLEDDEGDDDLMDEYEMHRLKAKEQPIAKAGKLIL